ncbi:MAG: IPT/TIG domain-containing protein [Solirubrobacteraceae bacterium]
MFRARPWNPRLRRLKIASKRSRLVSLSFAMPRAAANHASLYYRPTGSSVSGTVPLGGSAHATPRASAASAGQPVVNTFYTTGGMGEPWGTAIDSAGNVWFADPGCDFAPTCSPNAGVGQIGELTASSHQLVFHKLPSVSGNQPAFLAFDGSGNLWFTTPANSMIGEFSPSSGQFVGQWPVTPGSGPWDLTVTGGKVWYTEHLVSAVGSFDPLTHSYRDFQTPSANTYPYGIAANGGLIWFAENNSSVDRIAVLDTTSNNAISEYPIVQPLSGTPHLVAIDARGNPWWTEGWSNTIATLNPSAATAGQCGTTSGVCKGIQRFVAPAPVTCANSGTHTSGIAIQRSSGVVWFDNSLTAQIGSFDPSSTAFAMNNLSNCSAHPHDGLNLDGAGDVWFDEEFANAIGELILSSQAAAMPTVLTGPATAVGTSSATLSGSVNRNGQATTYHFDYGTSTSYGSQAPTPPDPSAGMGTSSQPVSANVSGLSPGTTYHYRLTATNASGTQYGSDETFMTAAASGPTITSFNPTSSAAGTAVTITGTNFAAATAVAFNGTPASYTVNSASQLSATVPAGAISGPISVTTPAGTASTSESFTVTSPGNVVAADRFNRTVTSGWGAADTGGSWTVLDPPARWSVAPGAGTVSVTASAQARALLTGVTMQDVDLLATVGLPLCISGHNCNSYLLGRYTGGSSPSYYRVGAVQGQSRKTVYLRAQRSDGSDLAADLDTGIPAAAGVLLCIRVEFQGVNPTTIRARIWPAGAAEPSTWLLNMTDSTSAQQSAGAVGVRARNEDNTATQTFQFRSYQATALH